MILYLFFDSQICVAYVSVEISEEIYVLSPALFGWLRKLVVKYTGLKYRAGKPPEFKSNIKDGVKTQLMM